jgi:hypothetical protein
MECLELRMEEGSMLLGKVTASAHREGRRESHMRALT